MKDVVIVGGGLGGLFCAWLLSEGGIEVTLIEKKKYPFHRVCGEYVSNEVIPFLEKRNLFPHELNPSRIDSFQLSAVNGQSLNLDLDLGGFGISRYTWDNWLVEKLIEKGVEVLDGTQVTNVSEQDKVFTTEINFDQSIKSKMVIGAFGKRSILDKKMGRSFIERKSPYVGVKYHVKTDFPDNTVALHNFSGGYCGINKVDGEAYNLCYLTHRSNLRAHKNIEDMQEHVLHKNPILKSIFLNSDFILEKPEVINEITFERKEPVANSIPMVGDSAGMITPLCGNGMAMAIHSAKVLSDLILSNWKDHSPEIDLINEQYGRLWNQKFAKRLWVGRKIQSLFGGAHSNVTVFAGKAIPPFARWLMSQTHGQPFH